MDDSLTSFGTKPSLVPEPVAPIIIDAFTSAPSLDVTWVFDSLLNDVSLLSFGKSIRVNNTRRIAGLVSVQNGNQVQFSTVFVGADVGDNTTSYDAIPPDIVGSNGLAVEAFFDFPLRLV